MVPRVRFELTTCRLSGATGYKSAALPLSYRGMAEAVGFEPTGPFEPTVFKTVAISQALPRFQLAHCKGLEPLTSAVTGRRSNQLN